MTPGTDKGAHVMRARVIFAAVVAAFAFVGLVSAQPYSITSANPLVIEKLLNAGNDTAAFLTNVGTDNGIEYHGRTNATRAGFDFTCTSDGGQGWTGLVYRDDDVTYRATIAAGQFGDPEFTEADWNSIEVYDGTIEPTPGTTGYDPACAASGALGSASPTLGVLVGAGAGGQTDPIPLSYLLKQMQNGIVRQMVGFVTLLISEHDAGGWVVDSDAWAPDSMVFTRSGAQGYVHVEFEHLGWDPDLTDEEFGPLRVLDSTDKAYHGAGFLAALKDSAEGLDYKQAQTIEVEHHREVTMDRETHIDIGAEAGVTIGGDSVGVSVETKLTTEFGTRVENSQTDSESRSTATTKEINYLFPGGYDTLLTVTTRTVSTRRSMRIDGVADMGLTMTWPTSITDCILDSLSPNAAGACQHLINSGNRGLRKVGRGGACGSDECYQIRFPAWQDFAEMMEGFNTDFPRMAGWLSWARGTFEPTFHPWPSIVQLRDAATRTVAFTGVQREQEDGVITVTPVDVTGRDLGAIQTQYGLPDDQTADPGGRISAAPGLFEHSDDTDTVTLYQAMESAGTGDVGLFEHSVARAAPGIPPFDPTLPADVWEAVEAAVAQHVMWHTDPQYTAHALPGGRERITRGPAVDDPVVYEG